MRVQRADVVQRPILDQTDADHVGNRHEAVRGIVLMVAGISGIGAIVAHDEHMSRSHFFTEREGAGQKNLERAKVQLRLHCTD